MSIGKMQKYNEHKLFQALKKHHQNVNIEKIKTLIEMHARSCRARDTFDFKSSEDLIDTMYILATFLDSLILTKLVFLADEDNLPE
jgi:hypothetical protein